MPCIVSIKDLNVYDRLLLLWNNTLHLTWIQKLTELLNITSAICIDTVFLLVIICNNWCLELYLLLFSGSFVILLLLPFLVLSISVCGFWFNRSHICWCDVNNYIKNKLSYSYALWILALFMQTKYLDRFFRAAKSSLSLLYIYQSNDVIILLAILKKKFLTCNKSLYSITLLIVVSNFLYCLYLMLQLFYRVLNLWYVYCSISSNNQLIR